MDKSVVRIRHDCTSVMNAYSLGYSAADNSFVQQNIINLFVAVAMKQSLAAFELHIMARLTLRGKDYIPLDFF
jgi:hypothetical protein